MSVETTILHSIEPGIKSLGCEIVQLKTKPGLRGKKTLELLIAKPDNSPVSIGDCKNVSKAVSTILEVEELLSGEFNLEVSSAGVERPLVKIEDYTNHLNQCVKVKLNEAVNSQKVFVGYINQVEGEAISIQIENSKEVIKVNFSDIKNGNIVLTDKLFKELLNKG